jgi:hypothetical protein
MQTPPTPRQRCLSSTVSGRAQHRAGTDVEFRDATDWAAKAQTTHGRGLVALGRAHGRETDGRSSGSTQSNTPYRWPVAGSDLDPDRLDPP